MEVAAAHREDESAQRLAHALVALDADVSVLTPRAGADQVERLRCIARKVGFAPSRVLPLLAQLPDLRAFMVYGPKPAPAAEGDA